MKLTPKQKNILNTVWLFCPNCAKSWRGINFTSLYAAQIREANKDITDDEVQRRAKAAAKANKLTGNQSALAQVENSDKYCCPYCGKLYTYDEIVELLNKNRLPIALSKVIVAIIKPFVLLTKLFNNVHDA